MFHARIKEIVTPGFSPSVAALHNWNEWFSFSCSIKVFHVQWNILCPPINWSIWLIWQTYWLSNLLICCCCCLIIRLWSDCLVDLELLGLVWSYCWVIIIPCFGYSDMLCVVQKWKGRWKLWSIESTLLYGINKTYGAHFFATKLNMNKVRTFEVK